MGLPSMRPGTTTTLGEVVSLLQSLGLSDEQVSDLLLELIQSGELDLTGLPGHYDCL